MDLSIAQNIAAGLSQRQQVKREQERQPQTIKNVIAEVTYHSFCPILFIKSELVSPAQTQELGITQGHEHPGGGNSGELP